MVKKIILTLVIILLVGGVAHLIAQNSNPDFFPFYSIKRLEEKIISNSKVTPQSKAIYSELLLNNRLKELQYIVSNKKYDAFVETSLRFSTTAGDLANLIIANNLKDRVVHVEWLFWRDQIIIKNLMKRKDENDNWRFIQDDINYLHIYSNKISKIK